MGFASRLQSLDVRVLGRRRPVTPATHRNGFAVGVLGVLGALLLAVLTGRSSFVSGCGGFLGVMIGSGIRWWNSEHTERRAMRAGIALGTALVLSASAAAWASHDRWADPRPPSLPPGFRAEEPTQFVQCDGTPQGQAYAYQARVSETPVCENGARPRVVLRP